MSHSSHALIILLMLLLAQNAFGQSPRKDLMNEDGRALIEDFEFFIKQLETIHPDPYSAFGGETDFSKKTLPNTEVVGTISCKFFARPDAEHIEDKTLVPDVAIDLRDKEKAWEEILKLFEK